jgi:hypothetical protein
MIAGTTMLADIAATFRSGLVTVSWRSGFGSLSGMDLV